ncbi:MAG: DUF3096 domain-containing protein [Acidobacteriota bacterium]|nr:DUF3096 domain-containing protein [Acidobacteriota bacterium]MDW3229827.1 DUF3096 domain-containing protein [Acidobacteriota bacterium]
MTLGIILIIAGVLIALFPKLLAFIVAIILILEGVFVIFLSRAYKRSAQRLNDPFVDFFLHW